MTPEQQAIVQALMSGGMPDAGGSPLRQRKAMERAQMEQQQRAKALASGPRSIESLLMQGGMTPGQMYSNAAGNDAPGAGPASYARERALAGNTTAGQPFDPLEALSAPQAMEQSLLGGESRAPGTSPRPQASPLNGLLSSMPSGFASVFSDLSPQEQQGIVSLMQQGAPVDQAFDAVLGQEMNAITRGR